MLTKEVVSFTALVAGSRMSLRDPDGTRRCDSRLMGAPVRLTGLITCYLFKATTERKNKYPDYHEYHILENIENSIQVGMDQWLYTQNRSEATPLLRPYL